MYEECYVEEEVSCFCVDAESKPQTSRQMVKVADLA